MPKVKTHKGTAKRIELSANGKVLRRKGMMSHLRRNKSKAAKRQFIQKLAVNKGYAKNLKKLLAKKV